MTLAKNKPTAIAPAIKQAIGRLLVQERFDLAEAARVAGISTERLRDEINRPHTRKYLREQRRAQIESMVIRNPAVLAEIRDHGKNEQARVQAIRASEALRQSVIEEEGGPSARPMAPGLVIVVAPQPPQPEPRLAGARTILEPGAVDPALLEGEIIMDDDELSSAPRAR
jgi:hypothetical protein